MYNKLTQKLFSNGIYLYSLIIVLISGVVFSAFAGDIKYWADINWLDVFSEGGMTLLAIFWFVLLLRSRPNGMVTQFLAIGLGCIIFSWSMDLSDEFIYIPKELFWHSWLESLPIPFALTFLSLGIYHWHKEELALSKQMVKRERDFREYRLFDKLIPVGGAAHLRKQLAILIKESRKDKTPLSLVAVDIDNFNYINRNYGFAEGDNILRGLCQLFLLNIREQDILCRLAGDRFVLLMPNTNQATAELMAEDLKVAVSSFAYRERQSSERVYLTASTSVTVAGDESSEAVIKRLNLAVVNAKQRTI